MRNSIIGIVIPFLLLSMLTIKVDYICKGAPADEYALYSNWSTSSPIIDGYIKMDEWYDAMSMSVNLWYDSGGQDDGISYYLYLKNDQNFLYIALDGALGGDVDSQKRGRLAFGFDVDYDKKPVIGRDTFYGFTENSFDPYHDIYSEDPAWTLHCSVNYPIEMASVFSSSERFGDGNTPSWQYELKIPLAGEEGIKTNPSQIVGMSFNKGKDGKGYVWPPSNAFPVWERPPLILSSAPVNYDNTNHLNENNLVAYWSFDEGSGTIAHDSSGFGNDGTVTGAQWVNGISGSALRFRDASTYVTMAQFPDGLEGNNEFTISFWVKIEEWPSAQYAYLIVFGQGDDYTYDRAFHILLDNDPGFAPYGTVRANFWRRVVPTTNTFTTGIWYNWVFVYDKTQVKMYQNGTFLESISLGGAVPNLNPAWTMKISGPMIQFYNGIMDEVSIYNYVRSSSDILNDFKAVSSGTPSTSEDGALSASASVSLPPVLGESITIDLTLTNSGTGTITGGEYSVKLTYWDNYKQGGIDSFWVKWQGDWKGSALTQLGSVEGYTEMFSVPLLEPGNQYGPIRLTFPVPEKQSPSLVLTDELLFEITNPSGVISNARIQDVDVDLGYATVENVIETVVMAVVDHYIPLASLGNAVRETAIQRADQESSKAFDSYNNGNWADAGTYIARLAYVLSELNINIYLEDRISIIKDIATNYLGGPLTTSEAYVWWVNYKHEINLNGFDLLGLSFPKMVGISSGLSFFTDPVNIWITDPLGRHSGFNPETGIISKEIPNALIHEINGNIEALFIPYLLEGNYSVRISAIAQEDYEIRIEAVDDSIELLDKTYSGSIKEGQILSFETVVKETEMGLCVETTLPVLSEPVEEPLPLDWTMIFAIIGVIAIISVISLSVIMKRRRNKKLVDWYYEKYPKETGH